MMMQQTTNWNRENGSNVHDFEDFPGRLRQFPREWTRKHLFSGLSVIWSGSETYKTVMAVNERVALMNTGTRRTLFSDLLFLLAVRSELSRSSAGV